MSNSIINKVFLSTWLKFLIKGLKTPEKIQIIISTYIYMEEKFAE